MTGNIKVPGDKSISHRAAILGAISRGETRIKHFLEGDDTVRTLKAFEECKVQWRRDGEFIVIEGRGRDGIKEPLLPIDLGNSGTGMRLLAGLFSGLDLFVILTGDDSLRSRPMGRVNEPLRKMGAKIDGRAKGNYAPLAIRGTQLTGIRHPMPVASAQIKSALLLAGLWARGETWVKEPGPARNHTEIMIERFGAKLKREGDGWIGINGGEGENLKGCEVSVPGDISSAAFFIVAALISPIGELTVRDVGVNRTRTGILDILKEMGAKIELRNESQAGGEPQADMVVKSGRLKGCEVRGEKVVRAIDEFPVLTVAAAYADGDTAISDASELRVKESDRIASMAMELKKMSVAIEEKPDGMIIHGGKPLRGAVVNSHGDHRVAMALAVAALGAEGETLIQDTECITTSFPGFEKLLGEATVP